MGKVPTAAEAMELMAYLSPEDQAELDLLLTADLPKWLPQVGPQTMALESLADILYYGGSAGGGKTDLLVGAALTEAETSIIFRRQGVQLVGIIERVAAIMGSRKGYNGDDMWRLGGGRTLEFGHCAAPGDWIKYQGRPHDHKLFDEIPHFTESQFRTLIGWKRTDNPKVRQRVIAAGNPPTEAEGEWVIRFWAPWLDPLHPNPAKPGELRWFITNEEGRDEEVPGPGTYRRGSDDLVALSRTFIPSSVEDNFLLMSTGYKATLQALPEPLRSQMLRGDFQAGRTDNVWQLIPTAWIKAAMKRWQPRDAKGPMTRLGYDVARGGADRSSVARRHGQWFDELKTAPGQATPDGPSGAAFVVTLVRNGAPICIDSIGVGTSVLDHLNGMGVVTVPVVGSEGSTGWDKTHSLRFRNKRAEMYWRLREALDPTVEDPLALPPDPELEADLCAVRYKVVSMGMEAAIQIRSKDDIKEVLGRSPDKGDSVAQTFVDEAEAAFVENDAVQSFRRRGRVSDWRAR